MVLLVMNMTKIFYISSETKVSFPFFDGYAFFHDNLVIGNKAYHEYIKDNSFEYYPDGCCVIISKHNDKIIVQRDYHGYYPLYYYNSETFWCVSSSILHIQKKLKEKNIKVEYDLVNIEIWKSKLALALQASNYHTYIKKVMLLPVGCNIEICNNKLHIEYRRISCIYKTYQDALELCLYKWRKRLETVLRNEIGVRMELTGGIDSRTVFSFFANERSLLKYKFDKSSIFIYSDPNHKEDFVIAKKIANIYDVNINCSLNEKYRAKYLSSFESYNNWRYYNVGRYSPIVFPISKFNTNCINFGGEGGEDNRGFYGREENGSFISFETYLDKYQQYFSKKEYYEKWIEYIYEALEIIRHVNLNKDISDSILHYREFRSTHHTSKFPFYKFNSAILGSKYFHDIALCTEKDYLESGQILYDIINSNDSHLLMIPFDKEYKNMSSLNIKRLKDIIVADDLYCGKIYYYSDDEELKNMEYVYFEIDNEKFSNYNQLQILLERSKNLINKNKNDIIDILGFNYFNKIKNEIFSMKYNTNKINLHADGIALHLCELIYSILL